MIEILYEDENLVFCVKPVGVSSEDDLPNRLKMQLCSEIFTLHRLDTPVSGVMVYAKNKMTAAKMSEKIAKKHDFKKTYLLVCEGEFSQTTGTMEDLLFKDSRRNKSFVVTRERKGVKKASLKYSVLDCIKYKDRKCSLVCVELETGRSHQIRVQFASRKHPLLGDGKYGSKINCPLSLFSHKIETENKSVCKNPPSENPWNLFGI